MFVHVLPELQAGQRVFAESAVGVVPFLEHHVYLVALAGFASYYGVERVARRSGRGSAGSAGGAAGGEGTGDDAAADGAFLVHLGSFTVYNGLIGYFFVHRIESDLTGLLLFTGAMALHVFVTDAGLDRHYDDAYRRYGRWVLAAALLGGWTLGRLTHVRELAVATLFAFLAGGVVLNVVKEEVPEETRSSFAAFAVGAAGYAALLLAV